jgi:hypothetical protein
LGTEATSSNTAKAQQEPSAAFAAMMGLLRYVCGFDECVNDLIELIISGCRAINIRRMNGEKEKRKKGPRARPKT